MNINTSKLPSKGFNTTVNWIQTSPMKYGEIIEYKQLVSDAKSDTIDWFISELLFWSKKYPDIVKVSIYDSIAIMLLVKFETIPIEREITLSFKDGSEESYPVSSIQFIDMSDNLKRMYKVGEFNFHIPTIEELLKIKVHPHSKGNFYDLLLASCLEFKDIDELYKVDAKYSKVFDELKYTLVGLPYVRSEGGEEMLIPLDNISSLFRDSVYNGANSDVEIKYSN